MCQNVLIQKEKGHKHAINLNKKKASHKIAINLNQTFLYIVIKTKQ